MPYAYVQLLLFILISILLGYSMREVLRKRHLHGLTRFLALECILAMALISMQAWLLNPLSPVQILSWSLLLGSLILALHGYRLLSQHGKPEMKLEAHYTMPVMGFYKYVRHPFYTSLILLSTGILLKAITLTNTLLFLSGMFFLYWTAREEEMENLDRFGVEYALYLDTSKMFLPFVF